MTASGWAWFAFALLQLAVAGYTLAAAATWRGAHLFPAPGRPLGRVPVVVASVGVAAATAFLAWVRDGDLSRFVGTGAVMLAAIVSLALLLRQQARDA